MIVEIHPADEVRVDPYHRSYRFGPQRIFERQRWIERSHPRALDPAAFHAHANVAMGFIGRVDIAAKEHLVVTQPVIDLNGIVERDALDGERNRRLYGDMYCLRDRAEVAGARAWSQTGERTSFDCDPVGIVRHNIRHGVAGYH